MTDLDTLYKLHGKYEQELRQTRCIEALMWLLKYGREIEFTARGAECFATRSGAKGGVSLCVDGQEQRFADEEEMVAQANICGISFRTAFACAEILMIY